MERWPTPYVELMTSGENAPRRGPRPDRRARDVRQVGDAVRGHRAASNSNHSANCARRRSPTCSWPRSREGRMIAHQLCLDQARGLGASIHLGHAGLRSRSSSRLSVRWRRFDVRRRLSRKNSISQSSERRTLIPGRRSRAAATWPHVSWLVVAVRVARGGPDGLLQPRFPVRRA